MNKEYRMWKWKKAEEKLVQDLAKRTLTQKALLRKLTSEALGNISSDPSMKSTLDDPNR